MGAYYVTLVIFGFIELLLRIAIFGFLAVATLLLIFLFIDAEDAFRPYLWTKLP